jgi:hypothetical protein
LKQGAEEARKKRLKEGWMEERAEATKAERTEGRDEGRHEEKEERK